MIAVLEALPTVGPRISQTVKVGVYTTLVGRATTVTTRMVEATLVVGTEEAKDGAIQVTLVDMTIDQEVIMVLHETEENGTMDRLAAKLMARATMTALEALCLTSMVILGRRASTANDSSTTGAISESVASTIPRIGSTNLLKRGSTNLPKGAAMRWSHRTSASIYQLRMLTCLIRVVPIAARSLPSTNGRARRRSRENFFVYILVSRQTSGSNGRPEGATLTVRGMEEVTLLELDQFFHDHDAAMRTCRKDSSPRYTSAIDTWFLAMSIGARSKVGTSTEDPSSAVNPAKQEPRSHRHYYSLPRLCDDGADDFTSSDSSCVPSWCFLSDLLDSAAFVGSVLCRPNRRTPSQSSGPDSRRAKKPTLRPFPAKAPAGNGRPRNQASIDSTSSSPLLSERRRKATLNMEWVSVEPPMHSYSSRFQGLCPLGHQEVVVLPEIEEDGFGLLTKTFRAERRMTSNLMAQWQEI
jgi:hypothetical protein